MSRAFFLFFFLLLSANYRRCPSLAARNRQSVSRDECSTTIAAPFFMRKATSIQLKSEPCVFIFWLECVPRALCSHHKRVVFASKKENVSTKYLLDTFADLYCVLDNIEVEVEARPEPRQPCRRSR